MTSKAIVRDLLDNLSDELSLLEIAREIEFLAGVHQGLIEADRGEFLSAEKLRAQAPQWGKSI